MAHWLYLLRHAQSAERQSSQQDAERDLSTTGMKEAATIGHFLKKNNYHIDLIVSSGAKRALSTSTIIHGILNLSNEINIHEGVYQASVRNLLEITNSFDEEFRNILIVGHNPYISYFAEYLTKAEIDNMEPAGLVSIRFEIDRWSEVSEGVGTMENFIHPSLID
jgi:phosphohistidine phosphatase